MITINSEEFYDLYFNKIKNLLDSPSLRENLNNFESFVKSLRKRGNKIFFAGNGASTTIASHAALDFMNQLDVKCLALNDPNMITCFSNDYGYNNFMTRAVQMLREPNDGLVLISSSGNSENVCNLAKYAKSKKMSVVTFTGFSEKNILKSIGDINFWVDSDCYNIVETVHMIWLVSLCDLIATQEKDKIGLHGRLIGTPNEVK